MILICKYASKMDEATKILAKFFAGIEVDSHNLSLSLSYWYHSP